MPSGRSPATRPSTPRSSAPRRRRSNGPRRRSPSAARYALAFLDALVAMNDEIVPELAWQMGRPTRYGGEEGGVIERTKYMVEIAERSAGAGDRRRQARLPPLCEEGPARRRDGHRAVELSLSDRRQHHRAGADRRQCGDPQACRADAAGRRALRQGVRGGRPAEGRVPEHRHEPRRRPRSCSAPARSTMSISPARWPAAAPSRRRRPAPS